MDKVIKKGLSEWERQLLGFAVENLGKSLSEGNERESYRYTHNVEQAQKNLTEFLNSVNSIKIKWSKKGADLSSGLHTYLRKYSDSKFSSIMWNVLHLQTGYEVWNNFIENLVTSNNVNTSYHTTEKYVDSLDFDLNRSITFFFIDYWVRNEKFEDAYKEVLSWK